MPTKYLIKKMILCTYKTRQDCRVWLRHQDWSWTSHKGEQAVKPTRVREQVVSRKRESTRDGSRTEISQRRMCSLGLKRGMEKQTANKVRQEIIDNLVADMR